jgi:hypothetical protein
MDVRQGETGAVGVPARPVIFWAVHCIEWSSSRRERSSRCARETATEHGLSNNPGVPVTGDRLPRN